MAQDHTPEGHYGSEGHLHHSPRQAAPRQGSSRPGPLRPGSKNASEKGAAFEQAAFEQSIFEPRYGWEVASDAAAVEGATELLGDIDINIDGGEWGADGALARALLSAAHTDGAPSAVRERVLSAVDAVLREPAAVPAFPADAAPVTTLSGVFEKRRPTTEAASCVESPEPAAAIDAAQPHDSAVASAAVASNAVASDAIASDAVASTAVGSTAVLATAALPDAALDAVPCDGAAHDALADDALADDALADDALAPDGLAWERDGSARERPSDEASAAFESAALKSAALKSAALKSAALKSAAIESDVIESVSADFVELGATSRQAISSEASGSELAARGPGGVSALRGGPTSDGLFGGRSAGLPPAGGRQRGVRRESSKGVRPASPVGVEMAPPGGIEGARSRGVHPAAHRAVHAEHDEALVTARHRAMRRADVARDGLLDDGVMAVPVPPDAVMAGRLHHDRLHHDGQYHDGQYHDRLHHAELHCGGAAAFAAAAAGVHCFGGPMVGGRCHRATDVGAGGPSLCTPGVSTRGAFIPTAPAAQAPIPGALAAAHPPLGSASASPTAPGAIASARAAAGAKEAAFISSERSMSARLRDGVVTRVVNLGQLAAAIVVGIVIGKVAHVFMAEDVMADDMTLAWSPREEGSGALRAESGGALGAVRVVEPSVAMAAVGSLERAEPQTIEPQIIESGGTRRARRSHSASPARASSRANGSMRAARAANARQVVPCLASVQALSASALPPAPPPLAAAPLPCQTPLAQLGAMASLMPPARGVAAAELERLHAASPLADGTRPALDDWLGEQLAILGQAERSLREGDPESVIRSLDDYQARFPDGLLGPQMASVRQRLEERFTAFIFP